MFLIVGSISGLSNWLTDATIIGSEIEPERNKSENNLASDGVKPTPSQPEIVSQTNSFSAIKKEVQVGVTLKETSWIQVIADGKTTFEGTLEQGSKRTWKAQKELTVKAGNAGGVLVSVNQEQAKKMGKLGQVEQLRVALN